MQVAWKQQVATVQTECSSATSKRKVYKYFQFCPIKYYTFKEKQFATVENTYTH